MKKLSIGELEYRGVNFSFKPMFDEYSEGKKVEFVMESFFIDDLI